MAEADSICLNILTLNVWGIPFLSLNRKQRIMDIGAELRSNKYDVASLQEVWTESDRRYLQASARFAMPYSHYFHSGVMGAGLLVLSKYPIVDTVFHAWLVNGYAHRIHHADWFGGKGVGFCRIKLEENIFLHLYNTHLHAEYDSKYFDYKAHRVIQAFDTAQFIAATRDGAAVQVLAGDLNSNPDDIAYKILLQNADLLDTCNQIGIATYRNRANTYTSRAEGNFRRPNGERIDHILYRAGNNVKALVLLYRLELPQNLNQNQNQILRQRRWFPQQAEQQQMVRSYSDHEAVHVSIRLDLNRLGRSANRLQVENNSQPLINMFEGDQHRLQILPHSHRPSTNDYLANKVHTIKHAIHYCNKHLKQLKRDQIYYLFSAFILFIVMLVISEIPVISEYQSICRLLKFLIFVVCLYATYMATLWNLMERNGVLSVKTAMEAKIISWINHANSVFSARMYDEHRPNNYS